MLQASVLVLTVLASGNRDSNRTQSVNQLTLRNHQLETKNASSKFFGKKFIRNKKLRRTTLRVVEILLSLKVTQYHSTLHL